MFSDILFITNKLVFFQSFFGSMSFYLYFCNRLLREIGGHIKIA